MRPILAAAFAASCVLGAQCAHAGYTVTDQGIGLAGLGLVPVPGQGYSPFWGGNTNYAGQTEASTDLFAGGLPHGDLVNFHTRYDVTPWPFEYSGIATTTITAGAEAAVGYVGGNCEGGCTPAPTHAALWVLPGVSGAPVFTDLHPSGYMQSFAQGANTSVQVGWGQDSALVFHPLVWHGTAASVQELALPADMIQGAAAAASSIGAFDVVGYGNGTDGISHPIAWVPGGGTYAAADILPAGDIEGVAVASALGTVGGSVITPASNGQWHAAFWGDASNKYFRDLHPAAKGKTSYIASSVYAMSGNLSGNRVTLVGLAVVNSRKRIWHAMVWKGSTLAPLDLQSSLGAGFVQSVATGVDWYGNISGAAEDTSGVWHQVYWGL